MFCYDELRQLVLADNVKLAEEEMSRLDQKLIERDDRSEGVDARCHEDDERNLRDFGAILLNTRKIIEQGRESQRGRGLLDTLAQSDLAIDLWAD